MSTTITQTIFKINVEMQRLLDEYIRNYQDDDENWYIGDPLSSISFNNEPFRIFFLLLNKSA